eukprot:g27259.t1
MPKAAERVKAKRNKERATQPSTRKSEEVHAFFNSLGYKGLWWPMQPKFIKAGHGYGSPTVGLSIGGFTLACEQATRARRRLCFCASFFADGSLYEGAAGRASWMTSVSRRHRSERSSEGASEASEVQSKLAMQREGAGAWAFSA